MSTSNQYRDFIANQLSSLGEITLRPMMGEYLLYYKGVLVGGIYDEKLLIKESPSTAKYQLPQVIPYDTAKRTMYYIEDVKNCAQLPEIILDAYSDLSKSTKKPRSRKK